ncbi:MAG: hypothetical protein Q9196_006255, partial [Gyalolechia fulgens]
MRTSLSSVVSLLVALVPQSVSAACECGYSTHSIKSNENEVYTDVLETDFLHLPNFSEQEDWNRQVWSIPPVGTAHWGRNMTLDTVQPNALAGDVGTAGVNGGDPGLQMYVRGGVPEGEGVPSSEIATARRDILYGSFRVGMKYTGENGTCGAFFFYWDDTQEIDVEFLSKLYTNPNKSDLLLVIHAPSDVPTSELFRPTTVDFRPDFGYHEYRFDWTPKTVTYYADGKFLWESTRGVPTHAGGLTLNHWSNGDPGWSNGPPAKDAHMSISYVKAYFNTTSEASNANYQSRCRDLSKPDTICKVPDQTSPPDPNQSTTFLSPNQGKPAQDSPPPPKPADPAPPAPGPVDVTPPALDPEAPAVPGSKNVTTDGSCG